MPATHKYDYALMQHLLGEVGEINEVLKQHRVNAGITFPDVHVNPSFISYRITLGAGVRVTRVTKLANELIDRITRYRNTKTEVRINEAPLVIEVSRPNPEVIRYVDASLHAPKHQMIVGQSYENLLAEDIFIDLNTSPHTLIASITGGGKSVLMTSAILSLAENSPPAETRIHLIDFKNDNLASLQELPHVDGDDSYAYDEEAALRLLQRLDRLKTERINVGGDRSVKHVLFVDELRELLKSNPEIKAILDSLISLGRGLGIHVIASTQHPLASEIGSIIKANFPVRIVGKVINSEASRLASGLAKVGAEALPGQGAFIVISGSSKTRIQSYMIDEEEAGVVVGSVIERFGSDEDKAKVEQSTLSRQIDKYQELKNRQAISNGNFSPKVLEYAFMPRVVELFDDYYDREIGEMRNGYQIRMVQEIFGERANKGGWNRKMVLDVVAFWKENVHALEAEIEGQAL